MTIVATILCLGFVSSDPSARLSVDQLIAGLERLDRSFDPSLTPYRLAFESSATYYGGTHRTVNKKVELARSGEKLYVHAAQSDSGNQRSSAVWLVWDGSIFAKREGTTVDYFHYLLPQALNHFEYNKSLFTDVIRHVKVPGAEGGRAAGAFSAESQWEALPQMVRENKRHYTLRPQLEKIDDAYCHVLEWPGFDVLWIDADRSFVVRRREFRLAGALRSVTTNKEIQQQGSGPWLPTKQETETYVIPGLVSDLKVGDVVYRQSNTLKQVKFGSLDEKTFRVPISDGEELLIHDSIRNISYTRHPAGVDPIATALIDMNIKKLDTTGGGLIYLINATVMGVVASIILCTQLARCRAPVLI